MALDEVEYGETERQFTFVFDEDLLIAAKHITEYPDVEKTILVPANENEWELAIDRKQLIEIIRRTALTADEDTHFLTIDLANNQCKVSTLDKFQNTSRDRIEINWPFADLSLGVNYQHVLELLTSMRSNQIKLYLGEAKSPKRLPHLRFEEEGFVGVQLQLRKDLGEAALGSTRTRPVDPVGWQNKNGGPQTSRRPSRKAEAEGAVASDISAEELEATLANI
jgi:hypothetical protein